MPEAMLLLRRNLLLNGFRWSNLWRMRTLLRNVTSQCLPQLATVIREKLRIICAARDSHIGHAVVEQVFGRKLGIDMHYHTISRLPLAGMTGHCVAMI